MFNLEKKIELYIENNGETIGKIIAKFITIDLDLVETKEEVTLNFSCNFAGYELCSSSIDVRRLVKAAK